MSHPTAYPDPRYRGDSGEFSATLRRANHEPELSHASGGGAHYLATGAATDGEFGLYRWDMGTTPSGPDARSSSATTPSGPDSQQPPVSPNARRAEWWSSAPSGAV